MKRLVLPWFLAAACAASAQDLDTATKGTVRVLTLQGSLAGGGSGFLVTSSGHIVTNHHVVKDVIAGSESIRILYNDTGLRLQAEIDRNEKTLSAAIGELPSATVVDYDPQRDLAILKAEGHVSGIPAILSRDELVKERDEVWSLGYPGSGDLAGPGSWFVLKQKGGTIVSKEKARKGPAYAVTAQIHGGNSGGPLVNACGEVVGITTFSVTANEPKPIPEFADYALRIDNLFPLLEKNGIQVNRATGRCEKGAAPAGAGQPGAQAERGLGIGGIVLGALQLALALAALGVALSKRGREKVKRMTARTFSRRDPPPAGTRTVLVGIAGDFAGSELELGDEPITLGRDPRVCQLVFPSAELISKRHCTIRRDAATGEAIVEDCWSSNGTFLGSGKQVPPGESKRLKAGERLYLGDKMVMFEVRLEKVEAA